MPGRVPDPVLGLHELIHRWKARQREILESLSPGLRAELLSLARCIKSVRSEISRMALERMRAEGKLGPATDESLTRDHAPARHVPPAGSLRRRSLFEHNLTLIRFLASRENDSATRAEILAQTDIPPGSLSELLRSKEFEQIARGRWRLKTEAMKGRR